MWVTGVVNDKVYDGTTSATVTFGAGGGGSANFVTKDVGVNKTVTFGGLGAGSPYAVFGGGGSTTASITPATLTITADSAAKDYGQVLTFSGAAFTSIGLVAGETIGAVSLTSAGQPASASIAGSPYAITPSGAVGGTFNIANYTTTYIDGLLTIAPVGLVITANNASKTYGEVVTFAGGAFTATGLLNGDTIGSVTSTSVGAVGGASVAGGPYAIIPTNAAGGTFVAANYTLTYVNGILAVTPAPLLVIASNQTKSYGDTITFTGQEFSTTGLRNGDTVGTATVTSAGAGATAGVLAGPYVVVASNVAGGSFAPSNYSIAYANGILTVVPAALVVTADDASKFFPEPYTFAGTEFTATGLTNGESIGAVVLTSPGAATTANASSTPYPISASGASGGSFTPANYSITYVAGDLRVAAPTWVANAGSVTLGQVGGSSSSGFTPNPLTDADYAVGAGGFGTDASAGEGVSGGTTLPSSGAPAGVRLAVVGDGVRMPAQQADMRFAQAAQEEAARNEAARLERAEQVRQAQATAPGRPYEAPTYPRKQDRN
jgi:hypothetical protein